MPRKNLLYAQSGGVTPVINATACGLIETARQNKDRLGKVYAGKDGIMGILNDILQEKYDSFFCRDIECKYYNIL